MQKNPTYLIYRCPMCTATVGIREELVGDVVDCPRCSRPFRAKIPEAEALRENDLTAEYTVDRPVDDEAVLKEVHPAMFRQFPFLFIGLWLVVIGAVVTGLVFLGTGFYPVAMPAFLVAGIVLIYFGYWWVDVLSTTLRITNKRTTLRHGIIARRTTEVQHDDVRNLQVNQSIWQRMFGVGDLAISSSGQDDLEIKARGLAEPNELAESIRSMQ